MERRVMAERLWLADSRQAEETEIQRVGVQPYPRN